MTFDFDIRSFIQHIQATKPPYECPIQSCGKVYKSYAGIHFHIYNFDHTNPENNTPNTGSSKKLGKKGKKNWHHRNLRRSPTPPECFQPAGREVLTFAQARRLVEVELDGRPHRINILEPLEIFYQDAIDNVANQEAEDRKGGERVVAVAAAAAAVEKPRTPKPIEMKKKEMAAAASAKLPEASFRVLDTYKKRDVQVRPKTYYRFIERAAEELDEEVEYDMDEEDYAWLQLMNAEREEQIEEVVPQDVFEYLMDRLEKESFFQSQSCGGEHLPGVDDDAVCCICNDGECQNSNVILFCDMCNLAVHQECYGIPYIPEGQWLCRRCLQSPSRAVDCVLCPNKGGAFKQTDDGRWAHVVCALWVPEVMFANTVFLEPIDSIENIPAARWKLGCYVCKQRGAGACIQCHKTNCYTAFHVTCAQQAGLYMKMEPVRENTPNGSQFSVRKTAFCDAHSPLDPDAAAAAGNNADSDETSEAATPEKGGAATSFSVKKAKEISKVKMRKARKILAEKRSAIPVVSIPTISPETLSKIAHQITITKKVQFLYRLQGYWTLKRQSRNGVPLIRRLHTATCHQPRRDSPPSQSGEKQSESVKEQLKEWKRLRQSLERARLLIELIRKREKLKREEIQVPDYLKFIKRPMDFLTMEGKVDALMYRNLDEFQKDFDLIVNNCMAYNARDTVFYATALRMRNQGSTVIRQCRKAFELIGFDPITGLHLKEPPQARGAEEHDGEDFELMAVDEREKMPLDKQLKYLFGMMDRAEAIKHGAARHKRMKQLKREIKEVRRKVAIRDRLRTSSTVSSSDDSDKECPAPPPPPPHPTRSPARKPESLRKTEMPSRKADASSSSSRKSETRKAADAAAQEDQQWCREHRHHANPTPGVNRRTAVLFGKKSGPRKVLHLGLNKRPGRPRLKSSEATVDSPASTPSQADDVPKCPKLSPAPASPKHLYQPCLAEVVSRAENRRRLPSHEMGKKKIARSKVSLRELNDAARHKRMKQLKREIKEVRRKVAIRDRLRTSSTVSSSDDSDKECPAPPPPPPHPTRSPARKPESLRKTEMPSRKADASSSSSRKSETRKAADAAAQEECPSPAPPAGKARGRGRGRPPGRPPLRREKLHEKSEGEVGSESPSRPQKAGDDTGKEVAVSTCLPSTPSQASSGAESIATTPTPPPGVNRRTAVLFGKKSGPRKVLHLGLNKRPGRPRLKSSEATVDSPASSSSQADDVPKCPKLSPAPASPKHFTSPVSPKSFREPKSPKAPKSPKFDAKGVTLPQQWPPGSRSPGKPAARKRNASGGGTAAGGGGGGGVENPPLAKKPALPMGFGDIATEIPVIKESFQAYRTHEIVECSSESDGMSDSSSSSLSSSSLSSDDSDGELGGNTTDSLHGGGDSTSGGKKRRHLMDSVDAIPLEPLDLVWAKCRGYPWYPALIINPKMPKTGYFHNGVPIPVPPDDVLDLQRKFTDHVFLVLFFDMKRTWQWLPRHKLELLGIEDAVDKSKLNESKKAAERKAVRKAFHKAIIHRSKVTGEPLPDYLESDSEVIA
ncbi:PREDICTED: peregrin-like [Priapulus caudatus]|uniref:Peregrin-like n=1 Tax=Priapulus caudatus TaxID=37621 RepID=A0ABM1EBG4_PRICU|nr:PREDICTED: peregrin-like [Priapulus caudatus]